MISFNKKLESTWREMIVGIIVWGILWQMISIIFTKNILYQSIGLWMGIILALMMVTNMSSVIMKVVEMEEGAAQGYSRKYSMIRYALVWLVFGILMVTELGNPLMAFAGVIGLKVAAYLQPFTHKILRSIKRR